MRPEGVTAPLIQRILDTPAQHKRRLVALVGPPASGKSTLAKALAHDLPQACVVPMDGFHLDNSILEERGLLQRKGSPDSFDVAGLRHLMGRLQSEDDVIYPVFDRFSDRAIAGAGLVTAQTQTVVVEGNYLLLDAPHWRDLAALWDFSVYLSVPQDVLRARLMQRWTDHGFSPDDARAKTEFNDLPNAQTTATKLLTPDFVIETAALTPDGST